ncbi:MAG: nucleoside kinase [Bacilli bacterium]|nr:nucleoside kinase [Bacilli bacterium]
MAYEITINGSKMTLEKNERILDIIQSRDPEKRAVAARVNRRLRDLNFEIQGPCDIEVIQNNDIEAMKVYEASLRYVVAMAFANCYPQLHIRFAYNVSRAISIHLLTSGFTANSAMLQTITQEIDRIIAADYPLKRIVVPNDEAAEIFKARGYDDKIAILPYRPERTVHLYECNGYLDYMYSPMVPSTGYIHDYKLRLYTPGFLLQYPRAEKGGTIPPFEDAPTFSRTLTEVHDWSKTVGLLDVASINRAVEKNGPIELINLCEARHNRMLCELGERIQRDIDEISLICIAGPSSSGKTTFANRLRIELLSRGIRPVRISLDDYYLERKDCPLDENGKPDLESIEALDIALFNQNMVELISGEEVTLPRFDFQLGKRVPGRTLKVGKNEPIIIEGIHALNERMTVDIPKSAKFKIFISPGSQLNLDDHNPVSLTDLRLVRRIVRDYKFRNASAEETLSMWPSVRAGEFKWIYATQEGSDYVYNSILPYELPIMRHYALPLLAQIAPESPNYPVAQRLMKMLKYFVDMDEEWVPSNSLMREFIGGSCYADV